MTGAHCTTQRSDQVVTDDGWKNAFQISRQLEVDIKFVTYRLKKWKISPSMRPHSEAKFQTMVAYYPPSAICRLADIVGQLRALPEKQNYLSLQEASDQIGASREWILKTLPLHDLPRPIRRRGENSTTLLCISPRTFQKLCKIRIPFAPEGWLTVGGLAAASGWSSETVKRKIAGTTLGRHYVSPINGHTHVYYPHDILGLEAKPQTKVPLAGDWVSASRMSRELKRSVYWVTRQIQILGLEARAEIRADDTTNPAMHYPPETFQILKAASEQNRQIAPPGWQTASQMRKKVGVGVDVIREFLAFPENAQRRVMRATPPKMRCHAYYPPSVFREFKIWAQSRSQDKLAA